MSSSSSRSSRNAVHGPTGLTILLALVLAANAVAIYMVLLGQRNVDLLHKRIDLLERDVQLLRLSQFHETIDRVIAGAEDDQQRCILIAEHIAAHVGNDYLGLGPEPTIDVLSWWETRRGLCSARSQIMIKALHRLNIQARLWNIYDYGFAHSVVKANIDGKWRLFDPSYGGFFLNDDGTVMGWDDITADPHGAHERMVVFKRTVDTDSNGARIDNHRRMRLVWSPEQIATVRNAGFRWSRVFDLPANLQVPAEPEQTVVYGNAVSLPARLPAARTVHHADVSTGTQCHYLDTLGNYHDNFRHEFSLLNAKPNATYRLTFNFGKRRKGSARLLTETSTGTITRGATGPVCSSATTWSITYRAGDGDVHILRIGLEDYEQQSYAQVDSIIIEYLTE